MYTRVKSIIFDIIDSKYDIQGNLEITKTNKYGMLTKKEAIFLKSLDAIALRNPSDNKILNIVYVLDICVYIESNIIEKYQEYNPTLHMISSDNGFWVTDETEYKIETNDGLEVIRRIACSNKDRFIFSHINTFSNFERYICYQVNGHKEYIDILGKKNWHIAMGIKHKVKTPGPELTRHVHILSFNMLEKYVEHLFDTDYNSVMQERLPAYYKTKERCICLDIRTGSLYGVSYSLSKPLKKSIPSLSEIEIEFWSRLIKENESGVLIDIDSYYKLIKIIESEINDENRSPGRTKIEWLEQYKRS